jgi:hypothetical protein
MHNGVIHKTAGLATAEASDTALYVKDMQVTHWEDEGYFISLANDIGYGNKFVVMNADGQFRIVNENGWGLA